MDENGQGEETQILHRVLHDNKDPRVPKVMMNMGYGWDQIQGL